MRKVCAIARKAAAAVIHDTTSSTPATATPASRRTVEAIIVAKIRTMKTAAAYAQ